MSQADHSFSLTPPSRMEPLERWGVGLLALGILSMLVAFLGNWYVSSNLNLLFGGAGLVAGGVLLSQNRERTRPIAITLIYAGLIAVGLFITKDVSLLFGIFALIAGAWLFYKNQSEKWRLPAAILFSGMGGFMLAMKILQKPLPDGFFTVAVFGLISAGGLMYYYGAFGKGPAGIKHHGIFHSSATTKGATLSWILAILMTGFYVLLYFFPQSLHGLIAAVEPLQVALTGSSGIIVDSAGGVSYNQWFLYGTFYTLAVIVMGFRVAMKYRHSRYQLIRTGSVTFFQLVVAFLIPYTLAKLNHQQTADFNQKLYEYNTIVDSGAQPTPEQWDGVVAAYPTVKEHYFHYFWPLGYSNLMPSTIKSYVGEGGGVVTQPEAGQKAESWMVQKKGLGTFGWVAIGFALFMSLGGVVILTYFFGKRWYCSWVCGCGGLAETAGDPFRQMSDKSLKAWRIERILIYSVLALISIVTVILLVNWKYAFLPGHLETGMKAGYYFIISQTFAGVVGTGFYPIMGSRVWCRFGCPQAAVLGIIQKYFSRFRITTNGGQCISCGNCSTYCEMGIDVKWYAQRGQNVVRASCVGCGVCSSVCPRGVLNLENGPAKGRYNGNNPLTISEGEVKVEL